MKQGFVKNIITLLIVPALILSCSTAERSENGKKFGGTYRVAVSQQPISLDPIKIDSKTPFLFMSALYSALVRIDANSDIVPHIAESWSISDDGKNYRFKIRNDVIFHNGKKLTADDVVFSLRRILSAESLFQNHLRYVTGYHNYIRNHDENALGIYKQGSDTVAIDLDKPFHPLLSMLSSLTFSILPKDDVYSNPNFFDSPIGTGAFAYNKKLSSKKKKVLTAFSNYFKGKPYLQRVEVVITNKKNEASHLFWNGHLENIPFGFNAIQNNTKVRYKHVFLSEARTFFLGFNTSIPPFDNPQVRKAFKMAIDINAIQEKLNFYPNLQPTHSYIPKGLLGYNPQITAKETSILKARSMLTKAGYQSPKDLGVIQFAMRKPKPAEDVILLELKKAFDGLGIKYTIDTKWKNFRSDVPSEKVNLFVSGYAPNFPDPFFLLNYFYSGAIGTSNQTGHKDDYYDSKLNELAQTSRYWRRARLAKELNKFLIDQAVVVPIYTGSSSNGIFRDYVQGFEFPFINQPFPLFESIWFKKEKT